MAAPAQKITSCELRQHPDNKKNPKQIKEKEPCLCTYTTSMPWTSPKAAALLTQNNAINPKIQGKKKRTNPKCFWEGHLQLRHPYDEGDLSPEKYAPWSLHNYEAISEPQMEMFLYQHPAQMLRACSCARGNQLQSHNKTLLEDYFSSAAFFSSCSKSSFLRRENKCGFPISKILLH